MWSCGHGHLCVTFVPCIRMNQNLCDVLMTDEMHNSYNQFHSSFLSALHVSNESSHSSSGAWHNILYYTVWYSCAGKSSCFEVVGKNE